MAVHILRNQNNKNFLHLPHPVPIIMLTLFSYTNIPCYVICEPFLRMNVMSQIHLPFTELIFTVNKAYSKMKISVVALQGIGLFHMLQINYFLSKGNSVNLLIIHTNLLKDHNGNRHKSITLLINFAKM